MDDKKEIKDEKLDNINGGWFHTGISQSDLTKPYDGQHIKSDVEKTNDDGQNANETRCPTSEN